MATVTNLPAPAATPKIEPDPHAAWAQALRVLWKRYKASEDDDGTLEAIWGLEELIGSTAARTPAGALEQLRLVTNGEGPCVMGAGELAALDSLRVFLERLAGEA